MCGEGERGVRRADDVQGNGTRDNPLLSSALEAVGMIGTKVANSIMASGSKRRIDRPHT